MTNSESIFFKIVLVILILVIGYILFSRTLAFAKGPQKKKLSFSKRSKPIAATIELVKSHRSNPTHIELVVTNDGTKELDLHAPVLLFKRWFTTRKFKILKVEYSEIYPILLEPGASYDLNISLDQLYESVPELQLACRMSVEMKNTVGKKFISQTIRLKWL